MTDTVCWVALLEPAAHHANRALDLIAALERSAKIEVLECVVSATGAGTTSALIYAGAELARLRAEAQP